VLYRYESYLESAGVDEFENRLGPPTVRVSLHEFKITSETKCGAWIDVWGEKRFVNLKCRKQFACRTKEEAAKSFIKRKERQIEILAAKIDHAYKALNIIASRPSEDADHLTI